MRRSNQRGFTLVELLVVIGIIAVLIGILLPALNKAREQAKTVKCAANMRSATLALQVYTAESKGWLPGPHTSGFVWRSSGAQLTQTDTSSDETPIQNMDWVSPTYGKSFKWPENDYDRLKTIYNVQLNCPSNDVPINRVEPTGGIPYTGNDLLMASYSAVIQFHAYPSFEKKWGTAAGTGVAPISSEMFAIGGSPIVECNPSYAPQLSKIGSAPKKVYLVEGSRYSSIANSATFNARSTETSFNLFRYQRQGGNFMVGGPFAPWPNTPYQIYEGASSADYTSKKISPIAASQAWRHNGKMNLAFFDGHVELRGIRDSIQVDLFVPKGTKILKPTLTFDPTDQADIVVN